MQEDSKQSRSGSADGGRDGAGQRSSHYAAEEGNDRRRRADVGLDAPTMSPASI